MYSCKPRTKPRSMIDEVPSANYCKEGRDALDVTSTPDTIAGGAAHSRAATCHQSMGDELARVVHFFGLPIRSCSLDVAHCCMSHQHAPSAGSGGEQGV